MTRGDSILGISAYYHDSAAAIMAGGDIVAAAQEERFSRKKHDARFPAHAIAYCLQEQGAAAFHRQLVKSDLSVEYNNEIRLWIEEIKELEEAMGSY